MRTIGEATSAAPRNIVRYHETDGNYVMSGRDCSRATIVLIPWDAELFAVFRAFKIQRIHPE